MFLFQLKLFQFCRNYSLHILTLNKIMRTSCNLNIKRAKYNRKIIRIEFNYFFKKHIIFDKKNCVEIVTICIVNSSSSLFAYTEDHHLWWLNAFVNNQNCGKSPFIRWPSIPKKQSLMCILYGGYFPQRNFTKQFN